MSRGVRYILLGMFILLLSWALWGITANFYGWLALFIPGSFYVLQGAVWVVEDNR